MQRCIQTAFSAEQVIRRLYLHKRGLVRHCADHSILPDCLYMFSQAPAAVDSALRELCRLACRGGRPSIAAEQAELRIDLPLRYREFGGRCSMKSRMSRRIIDRRQFIRALGLGVGALANSACRCYHYLNGKEIEQRPGRSGSGQQKGLSQLRACREVRGGS